MMLLCKCSYNYIVPAFHKPEKSISKSRAELVKRKQLEVCFNLKARSPWSARATRLHMGPAGRRSTVTESPEGVSGAPGTFR